MIHIFCRSVWLLGISNTNSKSHSFYVAVWLNSEEALLSSDENGDRGHEERASATPVLHSDEGQGQHTASDLTWGVEESPLTSWGLSGQSECRVVVGDGENRKESFSASKWIRSMRRTRKRGEKSQLYRLDSNLIFSPWHCWRGCTPFSETLQATKSQENQAQRKPFKTPFLLFMIIKTILKQHRKFGGKKGGKYW